MNDHGRDSHRHHLRETSQDYHYISVNAIIDLYPLTVCRIIIYVSQAFCHIL